MKTKETKINDLKAKWLTEKWGKLLNGPHDDLKTAFLIESQQSRVQIVKKSKEK